MVCGHVMSNFPERKSEDLRVSACCMVKFEDLPRRKTHIQLTQPAGAGGRQRCQGRDRMQTFGHWQLGVIFGHIWTIKPQKMWDDDVHPRRCGV